MPDVLESTTEVSVNSNPEVRKDLFRDRLTKTQLHRGTFYKFLLQAGIPFTPMSHVTLPTQLNVDRLLKKNVRKYSTPTTQVMSNLNKLSVVCRLDDVLVDDREVYVEIRYKDYHEMSNGEKNRLIATGNSINLITFFHEDFEKVGLKFNEGQKFVKTPSRTVLKKWADLLFRKLRNIKGDYIDIPYTLIDVKSNIDNNCLEDGDVLKSLKQQNFSLRKSLLMEKLSKKFEIAESHTPIVDRMLQEHSDSLKWIDEVMYLLSEKGLFSIDLSKKKYKQDFTTATGKTKISDKNLLTDYVVNFLQSSRRLVYVNTVSENIIEVCNSKTLQSFILMVYPTTAKKIGQVTLKEDIAKQFATELVFTLFVHCGKLQRQKKISKVTGEVILPGNFSSKYKYSRNQRLTLFESNTNNYKYTDWAV